MECAIVYRAIAEERHGNPVGLEQLETIARPRRLKNGRADDAAGSQESKLRREQMHAAAAPARAPRLAAKKLRDEFHRGQAFGQGMTVSAVRAENNVVRAQVRAHPRRDGFLSHVSMTSPMNQPTLMTTGQLLLRLADELHRAIQSERGVRSQESGDRSQGSPFASVVVRNQKRVGIVDH